MSQPELISIAYSPWSIKARWALKICGVDHHNREYLPMLGEPWLRAKSRAWSGRITVPVLIVEGRTLRDSFEIAQYAVAYGDAPELMPAASLSEIIDWNERAEVASAAGRVLTTAAVGASADALLESVPPAMRRIKAVGWLFGNIGVRFLKKKYVMTAEKRSEALEVIEAHLKKISAALSDGRDYLLGEFSYADIAVAVSLQFVDPVADEYVRLGKRSRRCWRRDALAASYADVLGWRDRVFEAHYPKRHR